MITLLEKLGSCATQTGTFEVDMQDQNADCRSLSDIQNFTSSSGEYCQLELDCHEIQLPSLQVQLQPIEKIAKLYINFRQILPVGIRFSINSTPINLSSVASYRENRSTIKG